FKSRETGDLVMLKAQGERLLEILGKDPSGPGVLLPQDMPGAVEAIRAAVQAEEAERQRQIEEAQARGEAAPKDSGEGVSLRMRTTPFIEMLQRAQQAGVEVVWGV